jgi:hypothetical protein
MMVMMGPGGMPPGGFPQGFAPPGFPGGMQLPPGVDGSVAMRVAGGVVPYGAAGPRASWAAAPYGSSAGFGAGYQ